MVLSRGRQNLCGSAEFNKDWHKVKNYNSLKRGVSACFTYNVNTNLKWIFEVSEVKKTRWPIYQRLIDMQVQRLDITEAILTAMLGLDRD